MCNTNAHDIYYIYRYNIGSCLYGRNRFEPSVIFDCIGTIISNSLK